MKLTMLGLGEASSNLAKALTAQGINVVAFDSTKPKHAVVPLSDSIEDAVRGADVVISLNSATVSIKMAELAAPYLKPEALFCDLNAATPALKKHLSQIVPAGAFVDVAVMRPLGEQNIRAELAVAGSGAKTFVELFGGLDFEIEYVSEIAGEAAARKLIRSILEKGVAALVIDTLWAAKAMGLQDWAIDEIRREFESSSAQTVKHYLDHTQQHPKRESVEIADVVEMLSDAKYESTMVRAIELTLSRVIHGVRVPFAEIN